MMEIRFDKNYQSANGPATAETKSSKNNASPESKIIKTAQKALKAYPEFFYIQKSAFIHILIFLKKVFAANFNRTFSFFSKYFQERYWPF